MKDRRDGLQDKLDIFSLGSIMFQLIYRTSFVNYLVKMHNIDKDLGKVRFYLLNVRLDII